MLFIFTHLKCLLHQQNILCRTDFSTPKIMSKYLLRPCRRLQVDAWVVEGLKQLAAVLTQHWGQVKEGMGHFLYLNRWVCFIDESVRYVT